MFLTEKCTGEVKARACANGSIQHQHVAKEEAAAPTVTSEAIFVQSTIYAHENRDVATCDIPGAFLQADNLSIMRYFLMNCPIDYSEDHVITYIPTSLLTLSKNKISTSSPKHNQPFVPLDEPTDILMKKRSLRPTPSLRGCVETKSHGTIVPCSSHTYEHAKAKVMWKDTLFPRHHPTSSPSSCTAK
jgi:hypothetical protein